MACEAENVREEEKNPAEIFAMPPLVPNRQFFSGPHVVQPHLSGDMPSGFLIPEGRNPLQLTPPPPAMPLFYNDSFPIPRNGLTSNPADMQYPPRFIMPPPYPFMIPPSMPVPPPIPIAVSTPLGRMGMHPPFFPTPAPHSRNHPLNYQRNGEGFNHINYRFTNHNGDGMSPSLEHSNPFRADYGWPMR